MKWSWIVILLVVASSVYARVGSINEECKDNGFDYGIAKFEWDDGSYEAENPPIFPFEINVSGNGSQADWISNRAVSGVLRKAGQDTAVLPGGTEGTAYGWETTNPQGRPVVHDISHLTFCKWSNGGGNGGGDPPTGVPEFSTITLALAIVGATLGFAFLRKD